MAITKDPDLPTLSQSKANTFNTCRQKYHLKYNKKLRRRRVARPLTFGSAVHKVIEDTINGVPTRKLRKSLDTWAADELQKMNYFTAEQELFFDTVNEAWMVMREYADFWPQTHLKYIEANGTKAEHEIYYPLPGEDFAVTGKVDAYAQSQNKLRWLVEHKTGAKPLSEDDRWRSIQAAVYDTVGPEIGLPQTDGIVWDMVRSKTPTQPKLLVAGTFSLARLDSMPFTVREAILRAEQDPNDYPTLLANAEKSRSDWFQRVFQPVTTDVKKFLFSEFVATGREINEVGHKDNHRMTIGKHCGWCDFESICRAKMSNDDVDYVIEKEYTNAEATPKGKVADKPKPRKTVRKKVIAKSLGTTKPGGRRKP